ARQEAAQQQQQQQSDPQPVADPPRRPAPPATQVNPALATIEPEEPQELGSGLVDTPEGVGATPPATEPESPRPRSRNTRNRSSRARTNGGKEPSAPAATSSDEAPDSADQGVTVVKIEVEGAPESDKAATG
ncbi:MAG: hypothetical protein D6754_12595, partial [Alphaproteobacteria bacterium]